MCPTALGQKEKKLYNVHIVQWPYLNVDDDHDHDHDDNDIVLRLLGNGGPILMSH